MVSCNCSACCLHECKVCRYGSHSVYDLAKLVLESLNLPCCLSVTNPNNPTGRILSEEEMEAVVAAARRADAWILADEVLKLLQYSLRLLRVVRYWALLNFLSYEVEFLNSSTADQSAHGGLPCILHMIP